MRADRGDVIITSSQALIAPGLSPSPVGEGDAGKIFTICLVSVTSCQEVGVATPVVMMMLDQQNVLICMDRSQ